MCRWCKTTLTCPFRFECSDSTNALYSPIYPDTELANIGDANLLDRDTAGNSFETRANINEARGSGSCAMLSSLSDCDSGDVWCHGEDCWSQYWTVFKSTSDTSCHSLMGLDPNKRLGGPMYCVKNRVALNGDHACSKDWDGSYIVYDNDNCDETGQTFQIPVQEQQGKAYELPSAGMSVRYSPGS
jgi:hypothetical protein